MRYNTLIIFLLFNLLFVSDIFNQNQNFAVIPKPNSIQVVGGQYHTKAIKYLAIPTNVQGTEQLGRSFQSLLGLPELKIKKIKENSSAQANSICLSLADRQKGPDYYKIHIAKTGIWIQAGGPSGWFYALQTMHQIVELNESYKEKSILPYCIIEDEPRFSYRGLHLDVSRHFYPVSFIKSYLDLMARFKYNTFHWHLTDDQGWRIEIKKFPKLIEVGSVREVTLIDHSSHYPQKFDSVKYGGYYTQEQIKEIVSYAAERYITVIPEIEMPGHSTAALAAYPEFSCNGQARTVPGHWGVFNSGIYCTRDTSFWFLQGILEEVCQLFPGPYIHIGGDECPKDNWKQCDQCQSVKRRHNLKSEEELQSYFIRKISKFLKSKGKELIGWDEILEGGLADGATIMSWRGMEGGIAAAKMRHPVIMCPGSHCYFDHYQSLNPYEPLAIGGFTSLEKTYSFEPVPASLKADEAKYIIGAQGNVWTEYIPSQQHVLYMAFPRAIALAEVNWSKRDDRNYADFLDRLQNHIPWFLKKDMRIAQSMLDLDYSTLAQNNKVIFVFKKPPVDGKILIESSDGGEHVSEYLKQDSFVMNKDVNFKAWYQLNNGYIGKPIRIHYKDHLASGKSITLDTAPSVKYSAGGPQCLINGIAAPNQKYGGGEWLGMEGKDLSAEIDLGEIRDISSIQFQFFHSPGSWIYRPKKILIRWSLDGKKYSDAIPYQISDTNKNYIEPLVPLNIKNAQFIKIHIENHGLIEDGLPGAGHRAWLFIGEITVL